MSNAQPNVLVLRAAGTNCDKETVFAFEQAGAKVDSIHLNQLRESPKTINNYQIMVFPGGFSFGDDISAGKIFSVRLRHELGEQIGEFVQSDKLVLGICNGFQILVKTGLLPDARITGEYSQTVTLSDNDSGKFEDRWVWLKSYSKKCVFIEPGEMMYIPSAHGEGKFIPHDDEVLAKLKANDQIVFRYVDEKGNFGGYPVNPNGSVDHIAGICDPSGRILGLMPHPERHIQSTQGPHWTRPGVSEVGGSQIFTRAINYFC